MLRGFIVWPQLISATGTGFTNYYHYDAQLTVAGVTDKTGHLAQRYVYDVWGQRQLSVPNPGIGKQNNFIFCCFNTNT